MNKYKLFNILTSVFCSMLLVSNILAVKTFNFFGLSLPTAVIVFPLVYIVNDILSEIYGYKKTKQVILLGFILNLIAVLSYTIAINLPPSEFCNIQNEFSIILGNTPRLLIASLLAYLIGSLANSYIMDTLKNKYDKYLMFRCITSTLIGEGIDASIFISIAFIGTMPFPNLLIMICSQAMFKTIYEIIMYPVTKNVIKYINKI